MRPTVELVPCEPIPGSCPPILVGCLPIFGGCPPIFGSCVPAGAEYAKWRHPFYAFYVMYGAGIVEDVAAVVAIRTRGRKIDKRAELQRNRPPRRCPGPSQVLSRIRVLGRSGRSGRTIPRSCVSELLSNMPNEPRNRLSAAVCQQTGVCQIPIFTLRVTSGTWGSICK
jgi:hypothetical protein